MKKAFQRYLAVPGKKVHLKDLNPAETPGFSSEDEAIESMNDDLKKIEKLQEKLFAGKNRSLLIILQAMDAAGKDGVIRHVMSGFSPQGCNVTSFRHPSAEDYEHDFLWRFNKSLPARGHISIFNRSYYEHLLICRVHPELVLNEKLPGYDSVKKMDHDFWMHRFRQVNRFEKTLTENGTLVIKFFLHISKEEQGKRLLARIHNPDKHWKFDFADINERKYWKEYSKCYREAIESTSTEEAPWYIVPADHKWYTRATVASILLQQLQAADLKYPQMNPEQLVKLGEAAVHLQLE